MSLIELLLILLLGIVMLLVGAGVLALLLSRPSWSAPVAGALAAMALLVATTAVLVTAAGS